MYVAAASYSNEQSDLAFHNGNRDPGVATLEGVQVLAHSIGVAVAGKFAAAGCSAAERV